MGMGVRTMRYVRGVADFLSAGRLCGRYVICMGDVANALSIIGLVTFVEIRYKTGFAVGFWGSVLAPLSIFISLTGFCHYRFRETRAMSLGQFLEMRYSRAFRIYAASLRSLAEMLANMIMPAIAARFFMRMLGLPAVFHVFGLTVSTYVALMVLFLFLAISLICFGGTLAIIVTDTVQGIILYPLLACFIIFLFHRFSVAGQILPVMADRVAGESFLDPYDIGKLRDFNVFTMVIVVAWGMVVNRANWIGTAYSTAAKTPHEQKMAGILGAWRGASINVFYVLVACVLVTFLNHPDFAKASGQVRRDLAARVADDVLKDDDAARAAVKAAVDAAPAPVHRIGVDPPLSQECNPDAAFLETVHGALLTEARETVTRHPSNSDSGEPPKSLLDAEGLANDRFQQCRTLFHQLSLSATMRHVLPPGLFGMFALLLFLAMLSTDDSRIYSAALTIAQDIVLPLKRKPFTPRGHIWMIRIVAICIGGFFLAGSYYMKQLDYIQMFNTLACSMWMSGAGPVMLFGLYSRFGTTAGAWAALGTSTVLSALYVFVQRSWADIVYPAVAKAGLVDVSDRVLRALSSPFEPYIHWEMDAVKCPVNTIEYTFFLSLFTFFLYIVVSKLTCREAFDLDRMLHRGKYALRANDGGASRQMTNGDHSIIAAEGRPSLPPEAACHCAAAPRPSLRRRRSVIRCGLPIAARWANRIVGITPDYTRGDRIIAWGVFLYSFVFSFGVCFLGVVIWNAFHRWPIAWWGRYFVIVNFAVPCFVAAVSTVWFGVGGIVGLRRLFRDLAARKEINDLDDGRVEGHVSLADKVEAKSR
jgi:Na+/proline symporter